MDPRLAAAIEARKRQLAAGASTPTSIVANGPAQEAIAQRFSSASPSPSSSSGGFVLPSVAAQQQESGGDGGFGGAFGFVLNNPVSRAILRPLSVLDYPRAGIVSGINELADALDNQSDTSASWGDWLGQTKEHIGFGDVIDETGNKWLDRAIGFAGDVALDPLTYVTLGAGRFAGASGRLAAAGEFAAKAADTTLDDATRALAKAAVSKVGKRGVGALTAEERALIGLDKAGLRFMGHRIAGTEGIAEAVSGGGGLARGAIQESRLGGLLRRGPGRSPELQAAMEKLFTGRGDLDPVDAANRYVFHLESKAQGGRFRTIQVRRAENVAKMVGRSHTARSDLTHAVETGATGELPDAGRSVLQQIRDDAVYRHGVRVESLGDNYMPHRFTEYGQHFLRDSDLPDQIVSNKGAASAAQKRRLLTKGQKVTVNGKTVTIGDDDTIRGLNELFKREFGATQKVFEDDFVKLTDTYIDEVSRSVGRAAGFNKLLERGSAWLPNDADVIQPNAESRRVAMNMVDMMNTQAEAVRTSKAWRGRPPTWEEHAAANGVPFNGDRTVASVSSADPEALRVFQESLERSGVAPDVNIIAAQADETPRGVALRAAGDEDMEWADYESFMRAAENGEFDQAVKYELRNGFKKVGEELLAGGEGVVVRDEMAEALQNVQKAIDHGGLWRAANAYTQFFKQYATLSPGFHLRNGMSASFMNFADGVSLKSQLRGIREWGKYLKDPDHYLDNVPLHERKLMSESLDAVYGSGGGAGQYSADELVVHGSRAVDNPATRLSRRAGARVEGVVRMGMAIDTIAKGGSVQEAMARIGRIHFDYSELSNLDRKMKQLVPFWTFMSRNLPLQTQQMWLKPRLYQQYQSLVRNMGEDYEGDMVPQSWRSLDAFKLTDGTYLAPDFAHTRQLKDLEDIGRIPAVLAGQPGGSALSDINPLYRVPLEMLARKNLFTGMPFDENSYEEATFSQSPELGLLQYLPFISQGAGPEGDIPVVDERLAYALRQFLPPLAQAQRLIPSEDEYYGDRNLQSLLSYLGIPLKQLTEGQTSRERERRLAAVKYADYDEEQRREALRRFVSGG